MTNHKRVVRKWIALSVAVSVLIGLWLALNRVDFHDFPMRGARSKTVGSDGVEVYGADVKIVQSPLQGSASSTRMPRSPTFIGDIFEAFGKPADVEVCGFGVQHVEEFPVGISLPYITASNETLNTAARNLVNSKIDIERALGLYIQAKLAGDAALERAQIQEPGCGERDPTDPAKRNIPPCSVDWRNARRTASIVAAAPLIEMAQTTTDPNVYATAYYLCEDAPRDARGACAPISAAGWARLDSENIFPQLLARNPGPYVSGLAKMPADNPPNDSPLPTARYDRRMLRFDRVMSQDVFKQDPLYMQNAISQWLIFQNFAPDVPAIQAIYSFCRPAEISRAPRTQACSDLVRLMGEQGKSYLDLNLALKLATDGKLPDVQLAKLKEENANYSGRMAALLDGNTGYSCEGMAMTVKYFADAFARGERAVVADLPVANSVAKP